MIQKQLTPVFLAMPSQHSLKCCGTNLRHGVSIWGQGFSCARTRCRYCLLGFYVFWVASKRLGVASFPLILSIHEFLMPCHKTFYGCARFVERSVCLPNNAHPISHVFTSPLIQMYVLLTYVHFHSVVYNSTCTVTPHIVYYQGSVTFACFVVNELR